MLGYVTADRQELKIREFDVYRGFYCGICKSAGSRYGQLSRFVLSYDAVFLALVLSAVSGDNPQICRERCIVHPIRKNPVVRGSGAVDYAADMMIALAYHKVIDDREDDRSLKAAAAEAAIRRAYKKVCAVYPDVCAEICDAEAELKALEAAKSGSVDMTAAASAKMAAAVFSGYPSDEKTARILRELGASIGRWIYLMDAVDDYERDKLRGGYNPLIYRKEGRDELGPVLYEYLSQTLNSLNLLELGANKGIIENIVLLGMRARTEDLLLRGKTETEHEGSI